VPIVVSVFAALTAAVPTAEPYVEVAHGRSEAELAAAGLAHSGWALAGCWAELLAYDLAPAEL